MIRLPIIIEIDDESPPPYIVAMPFWLRVALLRYQSDPAVQTIPLDALFVTERTLEYTTTVGKYLKVRSQNLDYLDALSQAQAKQQQ
jgi:hypothetical protein